MKDNYGNEYAKLSELKVGDIVETDRGFTCRHPSFAMVREYQGKLYILCEEGIHSLDGQLADEPDDDSLIGIYKV